MLAILATETMPLVSTLAVGLTAALIFGVVLQRLGFSPILGYLEAEDLVFVGDVNRDFQPFLVPASRLYEAMDTLDSDGNLKRGMLLIDVSAPPRRSVAD